MGRYEQKLECLRRDFYEERVWPIERLISKCSESPIETLLLWALLLEGVSGTEPLWASEDLPGPWKLPGVAEFQCVDFIFMGDHENQSRTLFPQLTVHAGGGTEYRIDIAVEEALAWRDSENKLHERKVTIAVECDGHDFHERTKEQAQRDKEKDRALQALGWHVARFTGSEIYANPKRVANQIDRFCWDLLRRSMSPEEG